MASSSADGVRAQGITQGVLSRVRHLDVTQKITDRSRKTVAHGGYCEVFTGRLRRIGNDQVRVAIKRLRFHTGEAKVMEAGPTLLSTKELGCSRDLCSNSQKKSTYGQSCPIQISYRCWATPSARKQIFPCSFLNGCIWVPPGRTCKRIKIRIFYT